MGRFWNWFWHGDPWNQDSEEADNQLPVKAQPVADPFGLAHVGSGGYAPPPSSYDGFGSPVYNDPTELETPPGYGLADEIADDDPVGDTEVPDPEPAPEPDEVTEDDVVDSRPGWQRKGRPYVHFRTLKVVQRENGDWKFKVHGRSGKRRHASEGYTLKSNAKRAALKWAKKSGIPTKFVDEQYDGQVVYDTNEQDA